MFVCLICGESTPAPRNDCPEWEEPHGERFDRLDPRLADRFESDFHNLNSCRSVELLINVAIDRHADRFKEDLVEDHLRPESEKYCGLCHGWGCQSCLGKGTRW